MLFIRLEAIAIRLVASGFSGLDYLDQAPQTTVFRRRGGEVAREPFRSVAATRAIRAGLGRPPTCPFGNLGAKSPLGSPMHSRVKQKERKTDENTHNYTNRFQ